MLLLSIAVVLLPRNNGDDVIFDLDDVVDDFKTCFDVVCRACRGRHNVCPSLHSQMLSASQNLSAWDELQKRSVL